MSPKKPLDVDFERDLPLTAADLEALDRARNLPPLSTEAYLAWLTLMSATSKVVHHLNTDSDATFEL